MRNTSTRPVDCIEAVVSAYGDSLFRLCLIMLGNTADAEDALQETFIKYMRKAPVFKEAEHEKAWLITTARNQCRDILRFRTRHPQTDIETLQEASFEPSSSGILEVLMSLPEKFCVVLTLHYVEGYRVEEIARMLHKTPSAIKMRLQKGRKLLEEKYRKEYL